MVADGYATAMMVLGTQASLALAKRENLAIMLIEKQDTGFKVYYSDAFIRGIGWIYRFSLGRL